jgi:hypothetical protein
MIDMILNVIIAYFTINFVGSMYECIRNWKTYMTMLKAGIDVTDISKDKRRRFLIPLACALGVVFAILIDMIIWAPGKLIQLNKK